MTFAAERGFARIGESIIHRGFVWTAVNAQFRAPDGSSFERDIVRSPGAVGVLPLFAAPDGTASVVLVRQYRPPLERAILEIPAGIRDVPGEDVAVTARRELAEEVGMTADQLTPLGRIIPSAGMTDSVTTIFLATGLHRGQRETHGPEEAEMTVEEMTLEAALSLVESGEIEDAKTVVALLRTRRLLDGTRW